MAMLLQCIKHKEHQFKDVYVLHNLAGNSRNAYVAMTRHIEEVKLYYNRKATRNMVSLISQLSKIDNRLS
ncbi:conjugal transfer TraA domain protein [Rickettsia hoogstraalii str. RCCE3]|nr:conjugal transfer TraA domain protein [Rickettsia hoogstraalii str. RCCE3]KJV77850.1 conjugal transfer TraA domain protein [Rickettsia hoogstraalii str. RCCE3]KJV78017.1 conjugal transfer TraA domain protein [Rickettsia hoogstraalii str. RCCE3]KJV78045.1 conjugal transfer TraA domain protein [Rickettsia hoogstraalii str. RCCE3]KJV79866.1 conjugal transfer TraA domain protein [Rickettsia hoogstraalii str. RCCE3]